MIDTDNSDMTKAQRVKLAAAMAVIGLALVISGLVMRSTEVHATGPTGNLICGTVAAYEPTDGALGARLSAGLGLDNDLGKQNLTACEDALSTRSTWSWILVAAGALAILAGLITLGSQAKRAPATEDAAPA